MTAEAGYRDPAIQTIPLCNLATTTLVPHHPSGPVRLVQVGGIAPYKGQLETIGALTEQLAAGHVRLDIVGRPLDEEYARLVLTAAAETPNVFLSAGWVEDAELGALISEADAAIGCQTEGLNTGVIYASVPLGTPTVCSNTAQARDEQERLGDDWILVLAEPTSPAAWGELIELLIARRGKVVDEADALEWDQSGIAHRDLYHKAMTRSKRRLESRRP